MIEKFGGYKTEEVIENNIRRGKASAKKKGERGEPHRETYGGLR